MEHELEVEEETYSCMKEKPIKEPKPITDDFNGDNEHLRRCIRALIELNDDGCIVPHGIGGHARALLSASYHRLKPCPSP